MTTHLRGQVDSEPNLSLSEVGLNTVYTQSTDGAGIRSVFVTICPRTFE